MKSLLLILLILVAVSIPGCNPTPETSITPAVKPSTTALSSVTTISSVIATSPPSSTIAAKPVPSLKLEDYNSGIFSIKKPVGWDVMTAGACSTFAFYTRDKDNPANQIFYFGEIGPVYLAEEQKKVDQDYVKIGGSLPAWFEMPVIDPLTPENFLENFHLVAQTKIGQEFMPGMPDFEDIEIVSMTEKTTFITGGQTKTIRALFRQGGELGEGLFYITVAPLIPLTGYAWGGTGYGFCITGITAVREDFKYYQDKLQQSLNSLKFSQQYIDDCLALQQKQGAATHSIGDTLSETSDIIMDAWDSRNRSDDILSEKRSDAILGYERVYDPDTGTVYETPPGFYDDYNLNRDKYNKDNLQLLPADDWTLWTAPTEPVMEIK